MSRNHYKGTPKTRDAVLRADGTLLPLSKGGQLSKISAEVHTNRSDLPKSTIRIYARETGNDSTGDGSLENPYRTFYKCMDDIPFNSDGRVIYIDISGIGVEEVDQVSVTFPPIVGGAGLYHTLVHPLPEFEAAGNNFYREGTVNIIASPTVVHSFTPSSINTDSQTGNKSFVSAGAGWEADVFKGKFLTNFSSDMFVIYGNTSDTIYAASGTSLTGEVSVVEPSATLMYGTSSKPNYSTFTPNFDMSACNTSLSIWGVSFKCPNTLNALDVNSLQAFNMSGCIVQGMQLRGSEFAELRGVYFTPGSFVSLGGPSIYVRYSFFDNPGYLDWTCANWAAHILYNSVMHGCSDFPHLVADTGFTYTGSSITINNTAIVSGTGNGLQVSSLGVVSLDRVSINDCVGDGIFATEGANVTIRRVYGTGNGGYGLNAQNGAQVLNRDTLTAVTGALGDFKVGVLPSDTWSNFNSGFKATLDITAVSGTLSRMYNPSSY